MKESMILNNMPQKQTNNQFKLNFAIFTTSRLISELGTSVFKFALSLFILDLTGSAALFSVVLGFTILPGVFINIFAGVFIDRHNKKKIIIICDFLSGITMLTFFLVFINFQPNIVMFIVMAVILSVIQAFFSIALQSSIPELVERENVTKLNSSYQALGAIINVIGPILGAIAYNYLGLKYVLIIEAISFLFAGVIQVYLKYRVNEEEKKLKSYKESLKDVFKYLKMQNSIVQLIGLVVVINFLLVPLLSVALPFIAYKGINVSGAQLSLMQAMWFLGIIVGAVTVSMDKVNKIVIDKLFILLQIQALFIAFWIFPKLPFFSTLSLFIITGVYCVILIIGGVFNAMTNIPMLSYLQVKIPEKVRASVFGVVNTAIQIAIPFGFWIYGLALEYMDWMYVIVVPGVSLIIIGVFAHSNKPLRQFFSNPN
ncbi:MFS transporter [Bacillus chungangensis]|uniref:MFS family permease n=1 Tax=Bacillus chungangensis TaxID=587633 RepID=A0ABT9WQ03_9BACI|nr:MFS transporter [Bacillus chungangensis]MDQ0175261.1 MFS family permease [Bacillus chungangensis]